MKRMSLLLLSALTMSSCSISGGSSSQSLSTSDATSSLLLSSSGTSQLSSSSGKQIIEKSYANPLRFYKIDGSEYFVTTADPDIIQGDDGYFYLYCTNCNCEMGEVGMAFDRGPIFKSSDMVNWTWAGSVFKDHPNEGDWGTEGAGIWGPSVIKVGSRYNYYYSLSTWGDPNPGIGVAVGDSPLGPWEHYGKLFDQNSSGVVNGIDPKPFFADNSLYLMWGSFHGIAITMLSDDGTETFYGEANLKNNIQMVIPYIENETEEMIDNGFEGSYLIEKDGYYYYFGSQGTCLSGTESTYNVKTGRSQNFYGPYLDGNGYDVKTEGHHGAVVIKPSEQVAGTGHNAVFKDAKDKYWLLYHGFDINGEHSDERKLFLDPLQWDEESGLPYVEGKAASINVTKNGPSYYAQ